MKNFSYNDLITIENLFQAWNEFKKGKRKKTDVMRFERNLENNLFDLHESLKDKTYRHSKYEAFYVNDPKRRHIHKAKVTDRIVHHLLYKYLYELLNSTFIYDSYSCRNEKGTHKAVKRLVIFVRKISNNYTSSCYVLHLDVQQFFASVDHEILHGLLKEKVKNKDILWLLKRIIKSYESEKGKGIPLGNVTSQIFANIYLNGLDQYVKHRLKIKYYIRYADDFIIVSANDRFFPKLIVQLRNFLKSELKLTLHPNKIVQRKLIWGIDFLGYVILPHYTLPRTKTIRRMFKKINEKNLVSYLGYLSHANANKVVRKLSELL